MLFGSNRDFDLLVNINRELLKDIVEQEVLYHKLSIADSEINLYGESMQKSYFNAIKLNCMITRGDQVIDIDEFGPNLGREASFAFVRRDLVDIDLVAEVGDIVEWNDDFYEVDTVRENQLFFGKNNNYNVSSYGSSYGESVSIIIDCHLTRADRVGIREVVNRY